MPGALAQYPQTWGLFLKHPIVQYDSLATLPLREQDNVLPPGLIALLLEVCYHRTTLKRLRTLWGGL